MDTKNNIKKESLASIIGDTFGRYAKYIIQDRALPDIRDGLKPVQRRILYAMNGLGLVHTKPYKKSARAVGEVIGKYHPHGDSSIYEAMVRMSQDWKNNMPLLDMHGNNGSIDGDSAAAMRYTESRLSKAAGLMLNNIEKNTVEFVNNFDDTEKEPTVLPSLLPNLLLNGSVGIAAGYATNIPTHNPTEVFNSIIHRIDYPNCSVNTLMKIIPGPDFPTGGVIEGISGVESYFKTGKGKFVISSKYKFITDNKKMNQLVFYEIPYDTNKSNIIKQMMELFADEKISGILEIRDETDKHGINIVVDLSKDANLEQTKNFFLKQTHLQISYSTNFISIVDRKPVLVNLETALDSYIAHAIQIIVKTAQFDLNKALDKFEIVEGLIKAINIIDIIITLIRKSDSKANAIENLINLHQFTKRQAEAIVNMQLYKLTRTNIEDLKAELEELKKIINELRTILNSEEIQRKHLKEVLREFRKELGYDRKTSIVSEIRSLEIDESSLIQKKELILSVSKNGYIKTFSQNVYDSNKLEFFGLKNNDSIFYLNKVLSTDHLVIITKLAKTFVIYPHKIKATNWKADGTHLNEFITLEANDEVVYVKAFQKINDTDEMISLTKDGLIKKTLLKDSLNVKQQKLSSIMKLKKGDEIVSCLLNDLNENQFITCLNNFGSSFTFSTAEIPLSAKTASGVNSMKLKEGEIVVSGVLSLSLKAKLLVIADNGYKLIKLTEIPVSKRYSSGKFIAINVKSNPSNYINIFKVTDEDMISLYNIHNELISLDLNNIKHTSIDTKLNKLFNSTPLKESLRLDILNKPIIQSNKDDIIKPYVPIK